VAKDSEVLPCRLSTEEAQQVRAYAADTGQFVSQVIRDALAAKLGITPAAKSD